MPVGNRFKTTLANDLTRMINATSFLGGVVNSGGAAAMTNNKWNDFDETGTRRKEAIVNNSVSGSLTRIVGTNNPSLVIAGRFNPYGNTLYGTIDAEKANRIYEYRLMSSFPEVGDAIEKICNSFICEDERGHAVNFRYLDDDLPTEYVKALEDRFNGLAKKFNFVERGREYCYDYLVDGEVFLELVINNETPKNRAKGIMGVLKLPTELMGVSYKDKTNGIVGSFLGRAYDIDQEDERHVLGFQYVPYHPNEVFYVSSNQWDPSGEWVVPFIERARKRYIQLSYLEDAIVIYRLVRAPERLVFTVDTGNMPAPRAEEYLRELQQAYWKQKTFDVNQGDIMSKFEPQSMLDAFWIAKGQGHDGTTISNLPGGQNLGQLDDLNYFIAALYRALHVPAQYLDPQAQVSVDQATILQQQLEFAEFVISIQRKFAEALKQAFITDLQLTGKYKEWNLKEDLMEVKFNVPNSYYVMRRTQNIQLAADAFNKVAASDFISKYWAMKRVMGFTNDEILTNIRLRRKEAEQEWIVDKIRSDGPDWKKKFLQQNYEESMEQNAAKNAPAGGGFEDDEFDGGSFDDDFSEFEDSGGGAEFGAAADISRDDIADMGSEADSALDSIGEG